MYPLMLVYRFHKYLFKEYLCSEQIFIKDNE